MSRYAVFLTNLYTVKEARMTRFAAIGLRSLFWILSLLIAAISLRFLIAPMAEVM